MAMLERRDTYFYDKTHHFGVSSNHSVNYKVGPKRIVTSELKMGPLASSVNFHPMKTYVFLAIYRGYNFTC